MKASRKIKGEIAETQVFQFLENEGLKLITRNYRSRTGEIDLIMRDNDTIVFVEVRTRDQKDFGDAIDSVNTFKQNKILKTAIQFLQKNNLIDKVDCRFDVVGVFQNEYEWIKNAFSGDTI